MAELVPPWDLEAPLAHARPTGILGISLAPQQLSVLHPLRSPEEHRDGVTEIQTWKDAGTAGPEVEVGTALRWHRTPLRAGNTLCVASRSLSVQALLPASGCSCPAPTFAPWGFPRMFLGPPQSPGMAHLSMAVITI